MVDASAGIGPQVEHGRKGEQVRVNSVRQREPLRGNPLK
jgi:hypothetical protein